MKQEIPLKGSPKKREKPRRHKEISSSKRGKLKISAIYTNKSLSSTIYFLMCRLTELDKLEKAVKDGSHSEYHKLLSDIESKRTKMLSVAEMRRSLAEGNVNNFFNSQKYAAYSQYYVSCPRSEWVAV